MRGVWLPVSDGVESWNVFLRGDGEADVKIARACVFPPKEVSKLETCQISEHLSETSIRPQICTWAFVLYADHSPSLS